MHTGTRGLGLVVLIQNGMPASDSAFSVSGMPWQGEATCCCVRSSVNSSYSVSTVLHDGT
jgi:hypothetical protein